MYPALWETPPNRMLYRSLPQSITVMRDNILAEKCGRYRFRLLDRTH